MDNRAGTVSTHVEGRDEGSEAGCEDGTSKAKKHDHKNNVKEQVLGNYRSFLFP